MASKHRNVSTYLERAEYLAQRCAFKRFGTGAIIVADDHVVSEGWAHMSSLRIKELHSIHAEIHALGRCRHIDLWQYNNVVIYIATVGKSNNRVTIAKPCLTCSIACRSAGISESCYTTNKERPEYLNLGSDLIDLKVYKTQAQISA